MLICSCAIAYPYFRPPRRAWSITGINHSELILSVRLGRTDSVCIHYVCLVYLYLDSQALDKRAQNCYVGLGLRLPGKHSDLLIHMNMIYYYPSVLKYYISNQHFPPGRRLSSARDSPDAPSRLHRENTAAKPDCSSQTLKRWGGCARTVRRTHTHTHTATQRPPKEACFRSLLHRKSICRSLASRPRFIRPDFRL